MDMQEQITARRAAMDDGHQTVTPDMRAMLRDIESRDPDGGTVEPTDAMRAAHERWACETYGQGVFLTYCVGGWGERPEV